MVRTLGARLKLVEIEAVDLVRVVDDVLGLAAEALSRIPFPAVGVLEVGEEAGDDPGDRGASPIAERRLDRADKRPAVVVEVAGLLVNGRAVLIDLEGEIEVGKREELGTAAERDGGAANDLSYRLLGGRGFAPMSNAVTAICRSFHHAPARSGFATN